MSKPFSLDSMMNQQSLSKKKMAYEVEFIPYESLESNKNNNYSMDRIEELALAILSMGLQQCLVVKESEENKGKFTIITGHRRFRAIGYIRENYPESKEVYDYVPCRKVSVESSADELMQIITTNSTIRDMSDADKLKQYEQLRVAINQRIKETGEKFKNQREILSKMLNVSETQIHRYKLVTEKLIPEFKNKVMEGSLSIQDGASIAALPQDKQQEVLKIRKIEDEEKRQASVKENHTGNGEEDTKKAPVSENLDTHKERLPEAEALLQNQKKQEDTAEHEDTQRQFSIDATADDFVEVKGTFGELMDIFKQNPKIPLSAKNKEKLIKSIYSIGKSLETIKKIIQEEK